MSCHMLLPGLTGRRSQVLIYRSIPHTCTCNFRIGAVEARMQLLAYQRHPSDFQGTRDDLFTYCRAPAFFLALTAQTYCQCDAAHARAIRDKIKEETKRAQPALARHATLLGQRRFGIRSLSLAFVLKSSCTPGRPCMAFGARQPA